MLNIQVFWPYLFFKKGKKEFFLDFLIGHYWLNLVLSCDSTSKQHHYTENKKYLLS